MPRYYLYEAGWSPRLIFIELFSTLLYVFFNFGTRMFGLIYIFTKLFRKKVSRFEVYILITVLVTLLLNIMLIQRGDWWNTVQFGYYAIFLSNIFLTILIYDLLVSRKKIFIFASAFIIVLTIPNNFRTISNFTDQNTLYISNKELEAMNFLKNQPYGVVFNSFNASPNYNFLDFNISGYVSVFTQKPLYLAHLGPLNIIGVNAKERENKILNGDCNILEEVEYLYIVKGHDLGKMGVCLNIEDENINEIYDNGEVKILENI